MSDGPEIEIEPDEWQLQIASTMRNLGFDKINYIRQEKMDNYECCIFYSGLRSELYSTETYLLYTTITILINVRGGPRCSKLIKSIMGNVEHEFVESGVAEATTFIFGEMDINGQGTSYRAEIPCVLREEINHD